MDCLGNQDKRQVVSSVLGVAMDLKMILLSFVESAGAKGYEYELSINKLDIKFLILYKLIGFLLVLELT